LNTLQWQHVCHNTNGLCHTSSRQPDLRTRLSSAFYYAPHLTKNSMLSWNSRPPRSTICVVPPQGYNKNLFSPSFCWQIGGKLMMYEPSPVIYLPNSPRCGAIIYLLTNQTFQTTSAVTPAGAEQCCWWRYTHTHTNTSTVTLKQRHRLVRTHACTHARTHIYCSSSCINLTGDLWSRESIIRFLANSFGKRLREVSYLWALNLTDWIVSWCYLSFTVDLFVPFTYTFIMAIIDKTELQQKEIVLSFFYFNTRSSVILFIATFVPMRYAIHYITYCLEYV